MLSSMNSLVDCCDFLSNQRVFEMPQAICEEVSSEEVLTQDFVKRFFNVFFLGLSKQSSRRLSVHNF